MFFWQEWDIVTIFCLLSVRSGRSCEAPAPPKVNGNGPSCRERHMYDELKKVSLQTMAISAEKDQRGRKERPWKTCAALKPPSRCSWAQLAFSSIKQETISAYTCTSASCIQQSSKVTNHKSLFFFLFLDEYAMQNVLSCNHRMFYFLCRGSKSRHLFQLLCSGRRGTSAALCGGHRESLAEMKLGRKCFRTSRAAIFT